MLEIVLNKASQFASKLAGLVNSPLLAGVMQEHYEYR